MHVVVMKSIMIKALFQLVDEATQELKVAQNNHQYELDRCKRTVSTDRPLPSLPLEIIQYIISTAYKGNYCGWGESGVTDLLFDAKDKTINRLFASTTIDSLSSSRWCWEAIRDFLKRTSPADVHFSMGTGTPRDWDLALPHASRIKKLTIYGMSSDIVSRLCTYKVVLFHTKKLVINERDGWWVNKRLALDEKGLETLQHCAPNLRIADLSIRFLVGLESSGLLANVVSLEVQVDVEYPAPLFKQYILSISRLKKLKSLRLDGFKFGFNATDPDVFFSGVDSYCHLVTSLQSLELSYINWEHIESMIPSFSSCDLLSLSALGSTRSSVDFVSGLSSTFPHLQQLRINTVSSSSTINSMDEPLTFYYSRTRLIFMSS